MTGFGRKKPPIDKKYATFNRRMMAATIDSLVLMFLAPMFNYLVPIHTMALQKYDTGSQDPDAAKQFLIHALTDPEFMGSWLANLLAQALFICFLSAICWHFWSATPGKMLLRIKIVDAKTEGRITDKQILRRVLGYMVSGACFMLGFFWIGIDKHRQGWHDKFAGTAVIVIPWRKKKKDIANEAAAD